MVQQRETKKVVTTCYRGMINFDRNAKFKIFIELSTDRCGPLTPYPNMITNLPIHWKFEFE